jgi:hypothetical protein
MLPGCFYELIIKKKLKTMNSNILGKSDFIETGFHPYKPKAYFKLPVYLFIIILAIYLLLPQGLQHLDATVGDVDQSVWLLIILSIICFLLILAICWWLLQYIWIDLGLPHLKSITSHFNKLELWQQLSFFWASFFSLLLAATGCLIALC